MPTNEYNLSPENVAAIVAQGRAIQVIESLQEAIKKLEADAIEYQYDGPISENQFRELAGWWALEGKDPRDITLLEAYDAFDHETQLEKEVDGGA